MAAQGFSIQLSSAFHYGYCHGLYLACIHLWCIFGAGESYMPIFSYTMALPKNKKSCLASAQRKIVFWGRWLSSFVSRHLSNSHCPARSLPGMLVGWENMRFANEGETVWVDANILWGFGGGGLKVYVKGRVGREKGEDTSRVGESFGWGYVFLSMC